MNEKDEVIDAEDGRYLFIGLFWVVVFWVVVGALAWWCIDG